MPVIKYLGIWMDNEIAHLIEFVPNHMKTTLIVSKFALHEKARKLNQENNLNDKQEYHQQLDYFLEIASKIKNYEDILLFGPTNAKTELYNLLKLDPGFARVKLDIKRTGNMTEKQKYDFVIQHFLKF